MVNKFYVVWTDPARGIVELPAMLYHIADYNSNRPVGQERLIWYGEIAGVEDEAANKIINMWNTRFAQQGDRRFFIKKEEAIAYKKTINEKEIQYAIFPPSPFERPRSKNDKRVTYDDR